MSNESLKGERVYLAGPMSNIPDCNFPLFNQVTQRLRRQGFDVTNPAEMDLATGYQPDPQGTVSPQFYADAMRRDIEALAKVDAIALLPGWQDSRGARLEKSIAEALNLKIYDVVENDWTLWSLCPFQESGQLTKRTGVSPDFFLDEQTILESETGGKKGVKLPQMGAIDPVARYQLARVAGMGGKKYGRFNYMNGYPWSSNIDAMHRHLMQFESGIDVDEESELDHMAHIAWHALALVSFRLRQIGTDDRIHHAQ